MRFSDTDCGDFFFFHHVHNDTHHAVFLYLQYLCPEFGGIFKIINQMPLGGERNFLQRLLWRLYIKHKPFTVVIRSKPGSFPDNALSHFMIGRDAGKKMFMPPGPFFGNHFIIHFSFHLAGYFFQGQFP